MRCLPVAMTPPSKPAALESADVGRAQDGCEVGVLTVRLLDASPARVRGDVEHRAQRMARPRGEHPSLDGGCHRLDDLGVERRRGADRCWKHNASRETRPCRVSSWKIAGTPSRVCSTRKRWIAFARDDDLGGAQVRRAGEARDLTHTVGQLAVEQLVVDPAVRHDLEGPHRAELGDLLDEGHPPEEIAHPVVDGHRGSMYGRAVRATAGRSGGLGRAVRVRVIPSPRRR